VSPPGRRRGDPTGATETGALAVARELYRGAAPTLLVSGVGGLAAGVVLGGMEAELAAVPGLLVLVPAFLAIRGSVYGSLGSRLSTALHQGLVAPRFERDERVVAAVAAALAAGVAASAAAAAGVVALLTALGRPVAPLGTLVGVALVAAALAGVALTAVVLVVVFVGFRRGLNPDDLVGPAVTTAGDVFGVAALLAATRLAVAL